MVKHVILWNLKDEYNDEQKHEIKANIKRQLEGLKGKIDGLLAITVHIDPLSSSNADLMLDSTFETEGALRAYATDPAHVHVADTFVRPHTAKRSCLDFEI